MTRLKKNKIRIFIVDDHPIVLDGLKQMLTREDNLEVCGSASDANKAIESIDKKNPDLFIVDISLKGGISGIELTKEIKKRYPKIPVLVLSMHDEAIYAERALRAGARGYIMKHEMTGTIINAIAQILDGKIYLSENMTSRLLSEFVCDQKEKVDTPLELLTDRELEVFKMISKGFRTSDIAKKLSVSVKTVDTYRLRIKEKFHLKDSNELAKLAIEFSHLF